MIQTVKSIIGGGYFVNGNISVPNAPMNRDYQEVQEWIAAGNTPDPIPEPTMGQIIKDFKRKMKSRKETFCCSGVLVTVTVSAVEYTGLFLPDDRGLEAASGVASYRAGVDATKPPVPMGDFWYTKDETGADIAIPITEDLLTDIQIAVKNWYTECNRVYQERKIAMPGDLTGFDPVADIEAYLPSRNLTVV